MTLDVAPVTTGDVHLLVPDADDADPEVSIVIPALNEALTITDFVAWCHQGLADAGVRGEILIVDSSDDDTATLALAAGARVLRTPKRGLGRAYIDALPFVRGRYVVMGDADCTYDFRRLGEFVERFHDGYEFVMGSRWKGSIEPGSMPALHRHFGTPFTTWILNRVYGSRFSDIHCGMRGITRDALERMDISSQSWEYASEMVLKSVHMGLRTAEVPVTFLRDREGRLSHHKRSGWFSPFQAAWINLRAMFVYGADFFALKPGLVVLALGLLFTLPLSLGPVTVGGITFSLYWMLLGVTLTIVGLQSVFLGCIAQVLYDYSGRASRRWASTFRYTRTVAVAGALVVAGLLLSLPLVVRYVGNDWSLPGGLGTDGHLAVLGLAALTCGFLTFTNTLLLHAALLPRPRGATGR
ncbi:MAG TPA: glycosyltransferase family 2 protein [Acidimicrobiales bacterium]|nr:glycosyltransferase family 2 protein [Acidimicrobiales bacterium]